MGQNSSAILATSKLTPDKGDIIVDASDSCVSGVKLRSTGIIPISELIKQEKCSKNIQKIETNYYNRKKSINKQHKDNLKSKKVKSEFIETSYQDVPARRQWVTVNSEPKKTFESDAVKIGIKEPSKKNLKEDPEGVKKELQENYNQERNSKKHRRERSKEHNRERSREHNRERSREHNRERSREHNRERSGDGIRDKSRNSKREEIQKNNAIRPPEHYNHILQKTNKEDEKKNVVPCQSKKSNLKKSKTQDKFKESSTQTMTQDKSTSCENVKQLYKRQNSVEKTRTRTKPLQPKQYKQNRKNLEFRDFEEESTHQFQTHEISHPKRKPRKYDNLKIKTMISCSIPPEKHLQWHSTSNENILERRDGRNYINRKLAGECYTIRNEKPCINNDVTSLNLSDLSPSVTLLPSASTLEQAIKEHRKYVSAKEALESWKNLHTWRQHKKRFQRSRNEFQQDNFNVATQTVTNCIENMVRNRSIHNIQTRSTARDEMIVPSEKHLYQDFIGKMEHCLQKHSKLCELNARRNGEGKFTWVQDKYRRWHKITFDDYKN